MNRRAAPTILARRRFLKGEFLRLAIVLLPMAVAVGCRSVSGTGHQAEGQAPLVTSDLSGPTLIPSGGAAGSTPTPTDPEPMPELTSPRTVNVHLDLGRVFESKGQLDAAEGEYRRALEAIDRRVDRESQAMVHRRLAATLDRQGKFADSEDHHLAATRLAPGDARTWNDAGYSAYLQGRIDEAIRLLRKAEKISPDDRRTLTNLGLALAASGRNDEALDVLSKAGGPAAAQANLAYILAATGSIDKARDHYGQALSLNPEHAIARQAIGRLDETPTAPELVAERPSPVDPAVAPASFESIEPPPIPPAPRRRLVSRLPSLKRSKTP